MEHRLAHRLRRDVERADEVVGDRPVVRVRGGRARRDRAHEAERDRLEAVRLRSTLPRAAACVRARLLELAEERVEVADRGGDPLEMLAILAHGDRGLDADHPAIAAVHRVRDLDARDDAATSRRARARCPRPSGRPCSARRRGSGCARRPGKLDGQAARIGAFVVLLREEDGEDLVERRLGQAARGARRIRAIA